MNCRWRYALSAIFLLLLIMCLYAALRDSPAGVSPRKQPPNIPKDRPTAPPTSFISSHEVYSEVEGVKRGEARQNEGGAKNKEGGASRGGSRVAYSDCRMSNCFDMSLCRGREFKVYVYPPEDGARPVSASYAQILRALQASRYYTSNPNEACLFVLSLDTLDRDRLSADYVPDIQQRLERLTWWRNGSNHIIFNLYSGTWPDYEENGLAFDVGAAMLAKASISTVNYRPGFDVSLPLFHREHPFRGSAGNDSPYQASNAVPPLRRYILSFKGKRYLTGIGSEVRNSLYHLHNGVDVVLLTTCKHGKGWKSMEDERCERDNAEYDRYIWDYKILLKNSTFCLVPRGRRLGSYRFLEALQAGCVPVLLSNDWVLPFSDVIDWSRAVVWGDERLLLQIPSIVRSMPHSDLLSMRQQTQFLYDAYFSSIERIVGTALEIIKERVVSYTPRTSYVWNTLPGANFVSPQYSQSLSDFPFYSLSLPSSRPQKRFTALVYATGSSLAAYATGLESSGAGFQNTSLHRLFRQLGRCNSLHKVVVLWHIDSGGGGNVDSADFTSTLFKSLTSSLTSLIRLVPLKHLYIQSVGQRFSSHADVETDAVISLDEDISIISDEIEFGLSVWREFPDRLVGYSARSHTWDEKVHRWTYTSKPLNDYSIILTQAAFYHRYYGYLYDQLLPQSLRDLVSRLNTCEDILFNFLIAHVTKLPPIKIGQRDISKANSQLQRSPSSVAIGNYQLHPSATLAISSSQSLLSGLSFLRPGSNVKLNIGDPMKPAAVGGEVLDDAVKTKRERLKTRLDDSLVFNEGPPSGEAGFRRRSYCVARFSEEFAYMPLQRASFRLDPLLYKDPVSIVRKKYRHMDSIT